MKISKVFALAGIATLASIVTGCSSMSNSDSASMGELESQIVKYKPIYSFEKQKVVGSSKLNVLFGFISWGDSNYAENGTMDSVTLFSATGKLKAAAVYKACKKKNADALLGSTYEIETTDYFVFKKVNCKVKGFPAKIIDIKDNDNIRKAKK